MKPTVLRTHGVSISGGAGGAPGSLECSGGASGPNTVLEPGITVDELPLQLPPRKFDIPSPIRAGESGTVTFEGTPGELAWMMFSGGTDPLYFEFFNGAIALANPTVYVYIGAIPEGGVLELPVTVNLQPGVDSLLAHEQGLFFSIPDGFVLGTPQAGWVLAEQF